MVAMGSTDERGVYLVLRRHVDLCRTRTMMCISA